MNEYITNAKDLGLLDENLSVTKLQDKLYRASLIFSDKTLEKLGLRVNSELCSELNKFQAALGIKGILQSKSSSDDDDDLSHDDDESFWDWAFEYQDDGGLSKNRLDKYRLHLIEGTTIPKFSICRVSFGEDDGTFTYVLTFSSTTMIHSVNCGGDMMELFAKEYKLLKEFWKNECIHIHRKSTFCEHCKV